MSAVATPTKQRAAVNPPMATSSERARADCKRIFGEPTPEDVIAPTRFTMEALDWMRTLLQTIAEDPKVPSNIKTLAEMGAYVAGDICNTADYCYGSMSKAIQQEMEGKA